MTMRRLLILAAILAALPALAVDHYIRPTDGNDSTCDGSENQAAGDGTCAWATIDRCLEQMGANDKCFIQSGSYTNQPVASRSAGGLNCTTGCSIKSVNGAVTLTYNQTGTGYRFALSGWTNLAIDGIDIILDCATGTGPSGVQFTGGSGNSFINSSIKMSNRNGARTSLRFDNTDNAVIDNVTLLPVDVCQMTCESSDQDNDGACGNTTGGTSACDFWCAQAQLSIDEVDGLDISRLTSGYRRNSTVMRNVTDLHWFRNRSINSMNHGNPEFDDVDGLIENSIWDTDMTATCNTAFLGDDALCGIDTYCSNDMVIRYNTFAYHGRSNPAAIMDINGGSGSQPACSTGGGQNPGNHVFNRMKIYGNIMYDTGQESAMAIPVSVGGYFYSAYNIMVPETGNESRAARWNSTDYSCAGWNSLATGPTGTNDGVNDFCSAPSFTTYTNGTSWSTNDYSPSSGSAYQVNKGPGSGDATFPCPAVDYLGNSRSDGQCDIGAFEYGASAAAASTLRGATVRGGTVR